MYREERKKTTLRFINNRSKATEEMHRDKRETNIENFINSREIKFYLLAARRGSSRWKYCQFWRSLEQERNARRAGGGLQNFK